MQGQPRTDAGKSSVMRMSYKMYSLFYRNVTNECLSAGVKKENLIWDMGFGFGKSVQHNYQLLQNLNEFCQIGYPVLGGIISQINDWCCA